MVVSGIEMGRPSPELGGWYCILRILTDTTFTITIFLHASASFSIEQSGEALQSCRGKEQDGIHSAVDPNTITS